MKNTNDPGNGTHCQIDGTIFAEDGFCTNGHEKGKFVAVEKTNGNNTHCPIDGTPYDEGGTCAHGHTRVI